MLGEHKKLKQDFGKREENSFVPLIAVILAIYVVIHDLLDIPILPKDIIVPIFFLAAFAMHDWIKRRFPSVKRTLLDKKMPGHELARGILTFVLAVILVFWHDLLSLI